MLSSTQLKLYYLLVSLFTIKHFSYIYYRNREKITKKKKYDKNFIVVPNVYCSSNYNK